MEVSDFDIPKASDLKSFSTVFLNKSLVQTFNKINFGWNRYCGHILGDWNLNKIGHNSLLLL